MTSTKIIVGAGRLSFVNLFTPKKNDQGKDVYSTALLLPPDYDLGPLKAALHAAAVEKWGENRAKWPQLKRPPEKVIRPAEESQWYVGFPGWHFINATTQTSPGVVNASREDVHDPAQAYAGRWARLSLNAFAYDKNGRGVTLGLNNVQLTKHDEPLSGRTRAADDFDEYVDDSADWQ